MTKMATQRSNVGYARVLSGYKITPARQPNPADPALQHFKSYVQFGKFAAAAEHTVHDFTDDYVIGSTPNTDGCTYTLKLTCYAAALVNGNYAEHEINLSWTFDKLMTAASCLRTFCNAFEDSYGVNLYCGEVIVNAYGGNYGGFAVYKIDSNGEWYIGLQAARTDIEREALRNLSHIWFPSSLKNHH